MVDGRICAAQEACFSTVVRFCAIGWATVHGVMGALVQVGGYFARYTFTMTAAATQPIVILISGSGSNMEALIRAAERRQWRQRWGAEVVAVVSNRADQEAWPRPRLWVYQQRYCLTRVLRRERPLIKR